MSQEPTPISRKNNFDLLRLLFATGVVFSHSFSSLGVEEPIVWNRSLGNLCVHGFFVISGYLISNSFIRMPAVVPFLVNRTLRIVPALIIALLLTDWLASVSQFFSKNPIPYISNGPIWTLTWEAVCYGLVVIFGVAGVLTRATMPAVLVTIWISYLLKTGESTPAYDVIAPMVLMFVMGAFIRVCQERINFSKIIFPFFLMFVVSFSADTASPVLNAISQHIPFLWAPAIGQWDIMRILYLASFPFIVMYLSLNAPVPWHGKTDVSYGVYIFAWPISQTIIYFSIKQGLSFNPYTLFLAVMAITLPVSWLSWTLVEKPAMRLKIHRMKIEDKAILPL